MFRMPNGAPASAPLAKLSAEDQVYLAQWLKQQPVKVVMPDSVGVETAQIKVETVSEDAAGESFIYRTQHFEFKSQGKFSQSLLREVARNFEATYELVKALPWGIVPQPESGTHFHAWLLKDKEAYYAAGAPPNSSGVYFRRKELFMVPFESVGLKLVGKSYAKDEDFDTQTMVHELTHQMMHDTLEQLPQWIVEGTAEYTGILPLRTGKFRVSGAKNALKDYIEFLKKRTTQGVPEPYPLHLLFAITNEEWNGVLAGNPQMSRRLYFTSYLLVYYFMHLDGKGDGQLFANYFRDAAGARKEIADYSKAMGDFKKLPGVVVQADGGFTYPSNLTPPAPPALLTSKEARTAFQKKTLQVLLAGRTEAELMKQIRTAYVRLGIRL